MNRHLSHVWTGRTRFTILRPSPPDGFKWCEGRSTRVQKTTRPENIWPEVWQSLSNTNKQKEIIYVPGTPSYQIHNKQIQEKYKRKQYTTTKNKNNTILFLQQFFQSNERSFLFFYIFNFIF